MSPRPGELRLIGGALCLDYCNTIAWRTSPEPIDRLGDYHALLAWSVHANTVSARHANALRAAARSRPTAAAAAYARAVTLRKHVSAVFGAIATAALPQASDLDACRKAYADALLEGRLRLELREATLEWPSAIALDRPLWPVADSAWQLLTSTRLPRVGLCGGRGCGWLFLDETRNGSRRWCSDDDCGRRERVRQHRARHLPRSV
jgi:predicted RNA-binding Zn ribbon-like protein